MVTENPSLAERLVTALHGVHGDHPGFRAAHAKGICAEGSFTASPEAAELTRAIHMQGDPVPVTVRFSNGSGAPERPDYAPDGRGIAVKLHLPDGSATDMVGLTLRQFFVRTPEDFIEFLGATTPDPATGQPDLARVGAFLQEHPETQAGVEDGLTQPLPASYLATAFNGIHSFKVTNASGASRFIRYRWEPEAGVETLEPGEAKGRGRDYLQDDLRQRLSEGPAAFRLLFFLDQEGDAIDDATAAWPPDRASVEVGRMVLEDIVKDQPGGCEARVFDPTVVTDGIECSADPILPARSQAYALSLAQRKGIRHPDHSPVSEEATKPEGTATPAPGGLKVMVSGERRVAVANVGGKLFGFDDVCTHRGCSLAEGTLDGTVVTCPCHGSQFDVTSGAVVRGPATEPVQTVELDAAGAPKP